MSSRRPRRWLRRLVVTVVVLGVLAVAVDRAAAWVAENQLATMAENEAAQYDVRAADTSVKIGGFGFLPQLARERFSKVTLTMKQPTFDSIPAEDLKVELHGVHVPRGLLTRTPGTAVTIDSTEVRLQLSPAELAEVAVRSTGVQGLSLDAVDGKLRAKLSVRGVEAAATLRPQVENGRLVLAVDQLSDAVPSFIRNAVRNQLSRAITLPKLPYGATLKQVSVEGNSVVLTATAADLEFTA
jgi:hypothetical protein